ncbi:FAD binding domain-containing protein [Cladophialophora immunda]|nr:FAD binding domain-containing protein [Cladophialophora immunda]
MSGKHIIIIGAGPSGLSLAALLQHHSLSFTLYEREPNISSRFQGGSLDLHPDSGQRALQVAGLEASFKKYARYHDQDYRFMDKHAKDWLFHQAPPDAEGRPEIDRSELRKILIEAVEPQNLKWDHHVSRITPRADGKYEVHFVNHGAFAVGDLIVGADGTWSKVRPLLTNTQPVYTGLTVIDCRISNLDQEFPELGKFIGRGTVFALSDGRGIFMQRNGDDSLRVYPCLKVPEKWAVESGIDWTDQKRATAMLLEDVYHDWDDRLKEVIRRLDPKWTPRPQYRMPLGMRYETQPGLTLIGDSMHVMSWFAGEGANLAMLDALDLFLCIQADPADLEAAVRKYEERVMGRADSTNKMSQDLLEEAMADDSPRAYVESMAKAMDVWFADGRLLEEVDL